MNITNYWNLPTKEQKNILTSNPITTCAICHKTTIKLVYCDACGEAVCFACAIPGDSITITAKGMSDEVQEAVICKTCSTF